MDLHVQHKLCVETLALFRSSVSLFATDELAQVEMWETVWNLLTMRNGPKLCNARTIRQAIRISRLFPESEIIQSTLCGVIGNLAAISLEITVKHGGWEVVERTLVSFPSATETLVKTITNFDAKIPAEKIRMVDQFLLETVTSSNKYNEDIWCKALRNHAYFCETGFSMLFVCIFCASSSLRFCCFCLFDLMAGSVVDPWPLNLLMRNITPRNQDMTRYCCFIIANEFSSNAGRADEIVKRLCALATSQEFAKNTLAAIALAVKRNLQGRKRFLLLRFFFLAAHFVFNEFEIKAFVQFARQFSDFPLVLRTLCQNRKSLQRNERRF